MNERSDHGATSRSAVGGILKVNASTGCLYLFSCQYPHKFQARCPGRKRQLSGLFRTVN